MKKNFILVVLLATVFTGCYQTSLYYWGNYSQSLYKYKKAPSDEALQDHMKSIEKIITQSVSYKKQVPPGIYSEYGYYLFLEGRYFEALQYFNLEIQNYPESEKFVNFLINEIPEDEEKE
ncbi:DUF4810 domain-containing protein [Candidatus Cloacimonadota bacterium]